MECVQSMLGHCLSICSWCVGSQTDDVFGLRVQQLAAGRGWGECQRVSIPDRDGSEGTRRSGWNQEEDRVGRVNRVQGKTLN